MLGEDILYARLMFFESKGIEIKTLTNLPFDENFIEYDLLNKKEKLWLENYQKNSILNK